MKFLHTIIVLSFSGVIFLNFSSGSAIQKLLTALLIIAVILSKLDVRIQRDSYTLILPFVFYLILAFLSSYSITGNMTVTLAAMQPFLLCLLLYIGFSIHANIIQNVRSFEALFLCILFVQVLIGILRVIWLGGVAEGYFVGSMSHNAGQLGFLFPAFAAPLVLFLYWRDKPMTALILILLLFSFGISNEKRSIIYVLPVIVFIGITINSVQLLSMRSMLKLSAVFGLILGGTLLGVYIIPSLNVGGMISGSYLIDYALEYLWMDYGGPLQGSYENAARDINIQLGRLAVVAAVVNWLSSADLTTVIFGIGHGSITPSSWVNQDGDLLFELIGHRGSISGAILALIETGVLGLFLISMFFASTFHFIYSNIGRLNHGLSQRWFKTVFLLNCIALFDFYFYSVTLFRTMPMPTLYFFLICSLFAVRRLVSVEGFGSNKNHPDAYPQLSRSAH